MIQWWRCGRTVTAFARLWVRILFRAKIFVETKERQPVVIVIS